MQIGSEQRGGGGAAALSGISGHIDERRYSDLALSRTSSAGCGMRQIRKQTGDGLSQIMSLTGCT